MLKLIIYTKYIQKKIVLKTQNIVIQKGKVYFTTTKTKSI